jgi:hypothetical protein
LSVLRNGAPDCPVHQDRTTQTSHSRVFGDAFHYNSPDCLVSQRATALQRQRSTLTREQCANSVRQKSEQKSEVHRTVSGVAPDCPVSHEDKASNGQLLSNPNGWVTWRHTGQCLVAHRTVRCAHRQQPSPTACWWLRAINTPNHHNSKHPSLLKISFNTRASTFTPSHKSKDQSLSMFQIHSNHLVT